jgi:hypothetical protein
MKYTRAKKLVWQSSKLAPLVCEFGWAICVYGGKSGREVYARSHTHGTIHTHTHTHRTPCVWCWTLKAIIHLFHSIERIVSLVDEHHHGLQRFYTLKRITHTHQSCRGAHTHTDTNFFFFFEGASLPFSHTWFSLESDNSLAKKWHDQDEKERLDENPVNFTNKPWCLWEFWSAAAHAEETETPSSYT